MILDTVPLESVPLNWWWERATVRTEGMHVDMTFWVLQTDEVE